MTDRQKLVAERAFELWERQGRPEGQDFENWLQAEREILGHSSEPLADIDAATRTVEISGPVAGQNSPRRSRRTRPPSKISPASLDSGPGM